MFEYENDMHWIIVTCKNYDKVCQPNMKKYQKVIEK
jgi:hypothetical protein